MTRHRRTLVQVFRAPALLAASSSFGLVASLVGDGAWDWLGAAALLVPAAVGIVRLAGWPRPGLQWLNYPARRRSFS